MKVKLLLGLLFCFSFLAVTIEAKQAVSEPVIECVDVGYTNLTFDYTMDVQVVCPDFDSSENRFTQAFRDADKEFNMAYKRSVEIPNIYYLYAMVDRSIYPNCPVTYLSKQKGKYHSHYSLSPYNRYNQPPNIV